MKMTATDYNVLKSILETIPMQTLIDAENWASNSPHLKDRNKGFRWSLYNYCHRNLKNWLSECYRYLNDDHIDTALKAYCKEKGLAMGY